MLSSLLKVFRKKEEGAVAVLPQEPLRYVQAWEGDPLQAAAKHVSPKVDGDEQALREQLVIEGRGASSYERRNAIRCAIHDIDFPRIDMSFLNWVRVDGKPVFAFFSICPCARVEGECHITASDGSYSDNTPYQFGDYYRPFLKRVHAEAKAKRGKTFETIYIHYKCALPQGLAIPTSTEKIMRTWSRCGCHAKFLRERGIKKWKSPRSLEDYKSHALPTGFRRPVDECEDAIIPERRFDQLYLIAEAPAWREETFIKRDPLLIGTDYNTKECWLLDVFDLTPAENIVSSEWATRRRGGRRTF